MKAYKFSGLFICLLCMLNLTLEAQIQVPQVGSRMNFAGMQLHLNEQARRDIQSSVDALYRSEKHFNIMLEKVDLYMPLIEPIFEKLGVPDEFKYLVIQESALVPDAISSSNAVGFWQFKESSATELNMRVDRQVDERMNIVSSTTGAARYLLRSNAEFDNWLYTLQSYMMGQGGTSRSVDKRHYGAREMKIDGDTHWYVKKFLSHMVAFENATGRQARNIILYQYNNTANKSLAEIAGEFGADEEQLANYNKWLKISKVPEDKTYAVVIPLNIDASQDLLAGYEPEREKSPVFEGRDKKQKKSAAAYYPPAGLGVVEFNNKEGLVAREGDSVAKLADRGGISESRFRKFNDLEPGDKILAGQFYYLEKKYRKAKVHEHVLQEGEDLWEISQRYGIRLKKLRQKNRLGKNEQPKPGLVLWLRYIRPRNEPAEYRQVNKSLYAGTGRNAREILESSAEKEPAATTEQGAKQAGELSSGPVQKKKAELPEELRSKAVEIKEEERIIPFPAQALYPADTPAPKQKEPQENFGKELLLIQKDSLSGPTEEGKVRDKNEQNEPIWEADSQNPVFEEEQLSPVRDGKENPPSPEPDPEETQEAEAEDEDGFSVDGPVIFVDEEGPAEVNPPKESLHQVKAGETLYSLSKRYNISVQELIRWNKLPAQPVINIGQQLIVSAPETEHAAPEKKDLQKGKDSPEDDPETEKYQYHTVSAGESMYRVARMYNVTIKDIMQWNNKENFDLKEGEELIVGRLQE